MFTGYNVNAHKAVTILNNAVHYCVRWTSTPPTALAKTCNIQELNDILKNFEKCPLCGGWQLTDNWQFYIHILWILIFTSPGLILFLTLFFIFYCVLHSQAPFYGSFWHVLFSLLFWIYTFVASETVFYLFFCEQDKLVVETILKRSKYGNIKSMKYDAVYVMECILLRMKSEETCLHLNKEKMLPLL